MTLIQTIVTDDFVIQVSDRRLTKGFDRNKSIIVDDDDTTKLISWNHTFTAGFTGLARIDRRQKESTALWIAETLCEFPRFDLGMQALKSAAQKRIRPLPKPWDRRLAIVVAGFDPLAGPVIGAVTNFDLKSGKPAGDLTEFTLKIGVRTPGSNAKLSVTSVAGGPMAMVYRRVLNRRVSSLLRQPSPGGANRAVRLMVHLQRLVAQEQPTVGADALCVLIPRVQQGPPGMLMSNLGGPDIATSTSSFGFFDHRGWKFEQRAPLVAELGSVRRLFGSADPDRPENQRTGFQFLRPPKGRIE